MLYFDILIKANTLHGQSLISLKILGGVCHLTWGIPAVCKAFLCSADIWHLPDEMPAVPFNINPNVCATVL